MPTSRRQNISTKPAIAARTEAIGIKTSGPIYTEHSSRDVVAAGEHASTPACTFSGTRSLARESHNIFPARATGNCIAFTLPQVAARRDAVSLPHRSYRSDLTGSAQFLHWSWPCKPMLHNRLH